MGSHSFCHSLHPTSPDPTGWDTFHVLKHALLEAKMSPSEIDYINSHAASNPMGDLPEGIGIQTIFGHKGINKDIEALRKLNYDDITEHDIDYELSRRPLVNSIKGNLGHPLLSSGSQEIVYTVKSMIEGAVTPIPHLEIPCVDGLNLVRDTVAKREIKAAVKSAFGFGGFASAIVMRKL